MRNISFLVVLSGCVQADQNRPKTGCEIPVATATGNKPEVVEQNDQGTETQAAEQHVQHPLWAVLLELGNRRGVSAACRGSLIRSMGMSWVDVPTLWSYASARLLLLCHELQCRTPVGASGSPLGQTSYERLIPNRCELVSLFRPKQGRLGR